MSVSPMRGDIDIERVISQAKDTDQPQLLIQFVQFLIRNPLVTDKQFYLAFIRIFLTYSDEYRGQNILPYRVLARHPIRGVTSALLDELIEELMKAANQKLAKLPTKALLRKLVRDSDGKEMIALVTPMMSTTEVKGLDFNDIEVALIFEWVAAMWNGNCHAPTKRILGTAQSFGLSDGRVSEMLAFLCDYDYFQQTDEGFFLNYRGVYTLEPRLTEFFPLRMCSRCSRLVVMTRRRGRGRGENDEMDHAGCTMLNPAINAFPMISYPLMIANVENIVFKKHRKLTRRHRVRRSRVNDMFGVTDDDQEDFHNEVWSDGEEAHYTPTPMDRIMFAELGLDEFGNKY